MSSVWLELGGKISSSATASEPEQCRTGDARLGRRLGRRRRRRAELEATNEIEKSSACHSLARPILAPTRQGRPNKPRLESGAEAARETTPAEMGPKWDPDEDNTASG